MKNLLLYLVQSLVDHPDEVLVSQSQTQDMTNLSLKVNPQDIGKVIGKEGKIIRALRNVVKILAIKEGKRVNIELIEDQPAN